VFLAQPDPHGDRHLQQIAFESDTEAALDGTQVWKALVGAGKALDINQLTYKSLLFNLRNDDYGKPLSEVRNAFWNAPRLPLLYDGESELQQAVWEGVNHGELLITDVTGAPVAVTGADQINLNASDRSLARPVPAVSTTDGAALTNRRSEDGEESDAGMPEGQGYTREHGGAHAPAGPAGSQHSPAEKNIQITLPGTLIGQADKADGLAQLFRALYAVMEDSASTFAAGTIQLVVSSDAAEPLIEAIQELGLRAVIKDQ
jgi:hypothetical protein